MNPGDLTTLTRLKGYLSDVSGSSSDAVLSRLISSCSGYIQAWLNRTIASANYTETRDGQGMQQMLFQNYPVSAVASVKINGLTIPPRPILGPTVTTNQPGGYVFDATRLMVDGWCFYRGFQNVQVSYTAGFLIQNEAQTIPGSGPYMLNAYQLWAGDRGVSFASGGALTLVSGAPAASQYSVVEGLFTFNATDAGKAVLLSYAYVPLELEQACMEMIGDLFAKRTRLGVQSKSIEGQSIAFTATDMSADVKTILNNYKKVAPIGP